MAYLSDSKREGTIVEGATAGKMDEGALNLGKPTWRTA